jgi:hypothetical protein
LRLKFVCMKGRGIHRLGHVLMRYRRPCGIDSSGLYAT